MNDQVALRGIECFRNDPRWKPGFDELHDVTSANVEGVTALGLRKLVELRRAQQVHAPALSKTAVLASGDLAFGLGRMYGVFAEETTEAVHVFRELGAAAEWMNAGPEVLEWLILVSGPPEAVPTIVAK